MPSFRTNLRYSCSASSSLDSICSYAFANPPSKISSTVILRLAILCDLAAGEDSALGVVRATGWLVADSVAANEVLALLFGLDHV